jgi:hypothetical protein
VCVNIEISWEPRFSRAAYTNTASWNNAVAATALVKVICRGYIIAVRFPPRLNFSLSPTDSIERLFRY